MSSTKRLEKLRHTHVLGIETKPGDSHTSAASLEDVVQLQRRAELAEKRLCEAAEENKILKQRIDQLQKCNYALAREHRGRAVYYTHAH